MAVRQQSKHEVAAAFQGRYKAGRKEKGQLLDEFGHCGIDVGAGEPGGGRGSYSS
jgi:hypothetical protein